ncbi:MAG: CCA tRNA nucleotidyltransferase [Actinobacteria bacterium]|jgi:poly(A) polymerase|nr:CCA tRNA nucleotidyltransferase [Actinomycetota bacterium]
MIPERVHEIVSMTGKLCDRFQAAGKQLYLVGGTVRDLILGKSASVGVPGLPDAMPDLDFATDARPDEIQALVGGWADNVWIQGKQFGTIAALKDGLRYEITTYRAEVYNPGTRNPEVTFGDSLEEDLVRRDFTVNSMALSLPSLELIDPFGGVNDLAAGRLRTPSSPEKSFSDDPLRMLRAARLIAGYHLVPVDELVSAVSELAGRIEVVSRERIRDELDKLLVVNRPSSGLKFLVDTGLAGEFLPELPALGLEQDPIHRHKDVLAHTLAVVDKSSPERLLRLAALFHDVGKPATRSFSSGGVSFYHHDVVGARMARMRMKQLRYSKEDIETVSGLVELHLRFHTYRFGWTDSAVRRYVRDAGPLLSWLNELTRCDCTTRDPDKARKLNLRMDELERRIEELRLREELDAIRPDLNGVQVMEHLGIPPGHEVGEALSFLLELRMDRGPLSESEAYRELDEWWKHRTAPEY